MQENLRRSTYLELLNFSTLPLKMVMPSLDETPLSTHNTLIPKDTGSSKIHRLRVIHLYEEADYNLILGVKWTDLLYHAVNNNILNPNQFGDQSQADLPSISVILENWNMKSPNVLSPSND
jgi:hypothetical protein